MTVDYLTFATGAGANVLDQASYSALPALVTGFEAGTALSPQLNKVWRQSSMVSAAVANLISQKLGIDVLDDGDLTGLIANLEALLTFARPINVKNFGAVGNGVADDTAAIKAAITAAFAASAANGSFGAAIYLPAGKYKVSSPIVVNTFVQHFSIFGDGPGASQIIRSGDYGDTFTLTTCPQMFMHDLGIIMTAEMTTGAHLNLNGVFQGFFSNLLVTDGFVNARLVNCSNCLFDNIAMAGSQYFSDASYKPNSTNFKLEASGAGINNGIIISNATFETSAVDASTGSKYQYAFWMQGVDGVWLSNVHLRGGKLAQIGITSVQGFSCDGLKASNVWCDFYANNCLTIVQGGTQGISALTFASCEFQGSLQDAININAPALNGCTFSSCIFELNTLSGGNIFAGTNIAFNGCFWLNNNAGATHGSTLTIANTNSKNITINGGTMSAGPNTDYNLNLSTTPNRVTVTGLTFDGSPAIDDVFVGTTNGQNIILSDCMPSSGQFNRVVASAASIRIPSVGNMFSISGTTNISALTNGWPGRQITLIFQGALTIVNGSTMSLAGGTFTTATNSTLSLTNVDGAFWFETSRKS